ncbi:MAG: hypothetical protein V1703_05050 [Candidatus Altiarchaeota archaeon]
MHYRYLKYPSLILAGGVAAGIMLKNVPVTSISLVTWTGLWVTGWFDENPVVVKKVKYSKDSKKFQVIIENTSSRPVWLKYAIRSITPTPVEATANSDSNMEFISGTSVNHTGNYLLLSENNLENVVDSGEFTIFESKNITPEDMWNPAIHGNIYLTLSYGKDKSNQLERMRVRIPVEVSMTHPYLRNVGVEREFLLTHGDGDVVGTAKSLRDMAAQVGENPSSVTLHLERGDIQKWIRDVVGDGELYTRILSIKDLMGDELLNRFYGILSERIIELNHSKFSGKHPLLGDVEPNHAFQLKLDDNTAIDVCRSMPSLLEKISTSPADVVKFHLERGNDFARWAANVLGDIELSEKLEKVERQNQWYAKLKILRILSQRVQELGG